MSVEVEQIVEQLVLDQETITFGKFKDLSLSALLKDRCYCRWVLKQPWFLEQYEYLHNRVTEYKPLELFLSKSANAMEPLVTTPEEFIERYAYFNLLPIDEITINLTEPEKICYVFYLDLICDIKDRIINNKLRNQFNIKAPVRWLKRFEIKTELSRDLFKEFLSSYELPNIPYIIEDVKAMGGIEYKGAKSYLIAKENSLKQEKFWEDLLKEKFGEDIGSQYKYEKCIFDFIHINNNTIYECKIGLKDFNEDQYRKYKVALGNFDIVYLISTDCVIDIETKTIYTTDTPMYTMYIEAIPDLKNPTKFDQILQDFEIKAIEGEGLADYL